MQTLNFWQKLYIPEILRGMWITTRHFWTNLLGGRHTVTQQYPEQPTHVDERYRGRHRLMRKEDGAPPLHSVHALRHLVPGPLHSYRSG